MSSQRGKVFNFLRWRVARSLENYEKHSCQRLLVSRWRRFSLEFLQVARYSITTSQPRW